MNSPENHLKDLLKNPLTYFAVVVSFAAGVVVGAVVILLGIA